MLNPGSVLVLLCIFLNACTSMQPIQDPPSELAEQLEIGDRLVIYDAEGNVFPMILTLIEEDHLVGAAGKKVQRPKRVPIENITRIEVEKLDGTRTALAVAGGTVMAIVFLPWAAFGLGLEWLDGNY